MEKSLADLFNDAFSDTSVPSFPDDELDFEQLHFKGNETILSHSSTSEEQEHSSALMETASTSGYYDEHEILDAKNNLREYGSSSGEECEEDDADFCEILGDFTSEAHCSPHDDTEGGLRQENIVDGEEIEPFPETSTGPPKGGCEKLGVESVPDAEFSVGADHRTSSAEERRASGAKIEQKAGDFIETVPCGCDDEPAFAMGQDLGQKDTSQNSLQWEGEIEKKSYLQSTQRAEGDPAIDTSEDEDEDEAGTTKTVFFHVEYTLEDPEISDDGNEELTDEVDKMEDFSGDEHQEAGESFAEYPSDFSSCEYVTEVRNTQELPLDCTAESQNEAEEVRTGDSLMDNERIEYRTGENNPGGEPCSKPEMDLLERETENKDKGVPQSRTGAFSTWSTSEDATESPFADDPGSLGEEDNALTTLSSSRGSVDDSFFFDTEAGQTEEDDEEEEKRREQERIQAFYRFYDEDGDRNRKERHIKVQFQIETLSQVMQYDMDSTERESSSSDEGEKYSDQDSEKPDEDEEACPSLAHEKAFLLSQEKEDLTHNNLQNASEMSGPEHVNKPVCARENKCVSLLKLILSLLLVVVMGLAMFWWWVSGAEEWSALFL